MNNSGYSDYKDLIKDGYTEEEIEVSLDGVSSIELSSSPMNPNRDDRRVGVTDSTGYSKRTSNIMMGYNKDGITLPNGEYSSWEEVAKVIEETLVSDDENVTYVCKKTGKKVEPPEIIDEVFKRSTENTYLELLATDKVKNQQAAQMVIHDPKIGDIPKGVAMLGNDGIKLPNGEYIAKIDIETALSDYIKLKKPEPVIIPPIPGIDPLPPTPMPPIPPEYVEEEKIKNPEPEKEETYKVIERITRKFSWIPIAIAVAMEVLFGFGKADVKDAQQIMRKATQLGYDTTQVERLEEKFETSDDVYKRTFGELNTGGTVDVDHEVTYYESSDHKYGGANKNGVVGETIDFGEYQIYGFSILDNGKMTEVTFNEGENLYSKLEEVSKATGKSIEELEPMISMIKIDGPQAGWVSAENLFSLEEQEPRLKEVNVVLDKSNHYNGVIEDFKGDTITINNGNEDVIINVKNEDGTFVKSGDIVIGSDGQKYEMSNLELSESEIIDYEDVKTGTKINWSLKNITLEEHLAAAAVALIGTALSLRKRKEMTTMTSSQIDALIDDARKKFDTAKDSYGETSEFRRATETLVGKHFEPSMTASYTLRKELIDQNITVENIQGLGDVGGKKI